MKDIEIINLAFSYDIIKNQVKKMVLKDIVLEVESGESIGIIGSNGVGKSTLLKLLAGIQYQYSGQLRIRGIPVSKEKLPLIRERTGYVFQDSDNQLFMTTVYEDVAFAPGNYGLSYAQVENRTMEALQKVHIEELKDEKIYRLSGGQKKLASIATVLSMQPDILLLDEPSVALDPRNRRNIMQILNEQQITKVIASHDLDFIYDTCRRTILLYEGRIVADGDTHEILRDKTLLEENGLELPLSFSRISNIKIK